MSNKSSLYYITEIDIGAIEMQDNHFEEAVKSFQASVQANSQSAEGWYNLAVAQFQLKDFLRCMQSCSKATALAPGMHTAHHLLGLVMQELGRPADAQQCFLSAQSIASQSASGARTPAKKTCIALQRLWLALTKDRKVCLKLDLPAGAKPNLAVMERLSTRPLLFRTSPLITPTECAAIMTMASASLSASHVTGEASANHGSRGEAYRSSTTAWLSPSESSVLQKLTHWVAKLSGLPLAYVRLKSERVQVVRYADGGEFRLHQDSSAFHPRRDGGYYISKRGHHSMIVALCTRGGAVIV